MNEYYTRVAELLRTCESPLPDGSPGPAPPYTSSPDTYKEQTSSWFTQSLPVFTTPVDYKDADGKEIFVLSDLHIAAGHNKVGVYRGTENFFADDAFFRFIEHCLNAQKTPQAVLVINGDIFDFLRVTEYPGRIRTPRLAKRVKRMMQFDPLPKPVRTATVEIDREFTAWAEALERIGYPDKKTPEELSACVSKREKKYGLQTDDYKTVYKLMRIHKGHPDFFRALALWMRHGNKIVVVKGNHDLELCWPAVRNYLRLIIADDIVAMGPVTDLMQILITQVLPNLTFIDDSLEIEGEVYIEHGHRYDKFSMVLGSPMLKKNPKQINIPFGSFFNRYLLNRVELFYPFLDNVRPTGNVLPMLMKANFPLGLKVLLQHIPMLVRMLFTNIRYLWFMLGRVLLYAVAFGIPLFLTYLAVKSVFMVATAALPADGLIGKLLGGAKSVIPLAGSYFLSRAVAWLQLKEPTSLEKYARIRFAGTKYRIITMGHTHNPGAFDMHLMHNGKKIERMFYNTGTWIPVIESSTAEVRSDRTFTFLHLERDEYGSLQPAMGGLLLRWNDDANRADPQVVMERK